MRNHVKNGTSNFLRDSRVIPISLSVARVVHAHVHTPLVGALRTLTMARWLRVQQLLQTCRRWKWLGGAEGGAAARQRRAVERAASCRRTHAPLRRGKHCARSLAFRRWPSSPFHEFCLPAGSQRIRGIQASTRSLGGASSCSRVTHWSGSSRVRTSNMHRTVGCSSRVCGSSVLTRSSCCSHRMAADSHSLATCWMSGMRRYAELFLL